MELEYLNNILENVYEHGSDGQGGYNVNKEGVIEAMQKYIKFRRQQEVVVVKFTDPYEEGVPYFEYVGQ